MKVLRAGRYPDLVPCPVKAGTRTPERSAYLSARSNCYVAAAATILLLTACSPPPPIVSADTSCERFAHISATDAQLKVYQDNWAVMESYADQIVEHNVTYDKACLGPTKP